MKFQAEWQEEVWDAFDERESIGDEQPFEIEAESLEKAKSIALAEAERIIDIKRPDKSHGMFFAHIIALIDENGVRHKIKNRETIIDGSVVEVPDE